MSDEDQSKSAPVLGPKVMAAIGHELRRMYPESLPKGCRNGLQRFCAGWTSQPARGRLGDAHTSKTESDLMSTESAECDNRIVVSNACW
jgi:hypothetical protein